MRNAEWLQPGNPLPTRTSALRIPHSALRTFLALILALTLHASAAEPPIAAGPPLPSTDLERLVAGELWVEANTSMKLPRGISSRASYLAPTPSEKIHALLPVWNPLPHAELEVHEYHNFPFGADPRFEALRLHEKATPFRKLYDLMKDRDAQSLSTAEASQIPASITAENATAFWIGVLKSRWRAFTSAGFKPVAGQFDVRAELKTLLAEEPKISAHFAALLAETPLMQDSPGTPAQCYWQVKNINGVAGFTIGAMYRRDTQWADFEFYVSSGYLAAVTLYELRTIEAGGKTGTLVWQENFASSPLLTGGFGLKRKLATMAIESDVRRSIRAFRKDLGR